MYRKGFHLQFIMLLLSAGRTLACDCDTRWNDSFSETIKDAGFIALVKIVSFDEFLEREVLGYDGKMPYRMTAEVVKVYKGNEQRSHISILGDNGILCRPYLSEFEIGDYYLIAPNALGNSADTDYNFFICKTDYLEVDIDTGKATGNYAMLRKQVDLKAFEKKLQEGDVDLIIMLVGGILFLLLTPIAIQERQTLQLRKTLLL